MSCNPLRTAFTLQNPGLQRVVQRAPPIFANGYSSDSITWDSVRVLLVGAGGIGCEVLHSLALSGFADITVIDMDTVELSNLSRQFLFREVDIGRSKAEVAAAAVECRCPGVRVRALFGRIEDQSDEFYRQFHAVILAVDSVAARRWVNQKVAEVAEWETFDMVDGGCYENIAARPIARRMRRIAYAMPLIDTGTEGYEGCCRVVLLRSVNPTPCIECDLSLYPSRRTVPLCTLENIPRLPEHCVLYVKFKLWEELRPHESPDADNPEHIAWMTVMAQRRKEAFGIEGPDIDDAFTLGVVKNVVPAVGFTNALVAAQAVLELVKLLTGVAFPVQCFSYYNGSTKCGLTSYVTDLIPNPTCSVCGPRPLLILSAEMTPLNVLLAIKTQVGMPPSVEDISHLDVTLRVRFAAGEVYLMYKSNNPLRTNVVATTIEEAFATSGYAAAFVEWCNSDAVVFTLECSGADIHISCDATMSKRTF
ncbi:ubiquitin-activating enzyme e1, putative [Trypanosoma brucei gambiense DAL972]|uniref:NEDD8-activating enzyme E1 catalytic subunit n=1 Tax=Trypanosoma brucei gambiense (strain MHOM/CI/86/DAL972) TaxID=679716 RepID=C9ZXM5_TRYB9|nr:ubiquitin-activating enzyme e1, putative [Trypanosoma brucei gambiense DAL972]CBH14169.1 ubiquitin-activating enzyme e1, putative [Trypanosoma brucei gambiense DAL972]|eukprot:XP_011776440.1 ubiquitin-activating enzyme e1, putative [Trypanosoma brucei gambiense DAL972]